MRRLLILASASPRRAEIMQAMGLRFATLPQDVAELESGAPPAALTLANARAKAEAAAGSAEAARLAGDPPYGGGFIAIGADTVVHKGGEVIGKPADGADAVRILSALSGGVCEVYTGLWLCAGPGGPHAEGCEVSRVRVGRMAPASIEAYVRTGEPFGKSGAFTVFGKGSPFFDEIDGSYTNVMGLPAGMLYRSLASLGYGVEGNWA